MKKITSYILFLCFCQLSFGQLVINELDCDTPGTDTQEFVEIKSDTPNFALDGYVVVFFNGSASGGDSSYFTIDLDGYTTDVNGLLLIGSNSVSPVPQLLISESVIQNGADAVAIYQANDFDFLQGTVATTTNLIDALVYDTGEADDINLMALLGVSTQISEGGNNNTNSIQRNNDGTYTVTTPTPRQLNDGSGTVLNGISITVSNNQYNEGENFDIQFTAEQNVTADLNLTISLNNGTFTTADYTGTTTVTIPNGQNSVTTTITLIDDADDEGDEELIISLTENFPIEYITLNNNVLVRVVDNDYTTAVWGTPTNPTFDQVTSTQPSGYYNSMDGLADAALRQAMQDIIANPSVVRAQTYADVYDILKEADQNPENSNQVWLVYTEQGRAKLDIQSSSNNAGTWNREHTFPRSRGGFSDIEADDTADGRDIYWTTKADSLRHANSDAHAIRASDGPENSSRGNQHYGVAGGQYDGPTGNLGSFKGDVARSVLYLTVRYNGLEIVNGSPSTVGELGDLVTLLDWHRNDPPDDYEMNRNNIVYTWQFNRNPFIDHPELVEHIWGNLTGTAWILPLSTTEFDANSIYIYPNPAQDQLTIAGIEGKMTIEIITIDGRSLLKKEVIGKQTIQLNLNSGIYLTNIVSQGKSIRKKIIIK